MKTRNTSLVASAIVLLLSSSATAPVHGQAQNFALSFDGVDGVVTVPHTAALNAYPLTIMCWFKTTQTNAQAALVNKYFSGSFSGYQVFLSNGRLQAWYIRNFPNNVYNGGPLDAGIVNDGLWHHAAFTVDASGGRLYLDGILKAAGLSSMMPRAMATPETSSVVSPGCLLSRRRLCWRQRRWPPPESPPTVLPSTARLCQTAWTRALSSNTAPRPITARFPPPSSFPPKARLSVHKASSPDCCPARIIITDSSSLTFSAPSRVRTALSTLSGLREAPPLSPPWRTTDLVRSVKRLKPRPTPSSLKSLAQLISPAAGCW